MLKTYISTGFRIDDGRTHVLALQGCPKCGGSGASAHENHGRNQTGMFQRNAPCHCGSGIKYKKCCGLRPRDMSDCVPLGCSCIITTELNIGSVRI